MSFEQDYLTVRNSAKALDDHEQQFHKQASLLAAAGAVATAEATMKGLSRLGKQHDASLLRAGVELGSQGRKMNPYTENISRNVLGNKQLAPYDAGLAIGKRMQPMEPGRQERFLNKVVGMGSARKDRLVSEGQKIKDPVLNALENYQVGRDLKSPGVNKFLLKGSRPIDNSDLKHQVAANAATIPAALLDSRAVIRPALRAAEKTPAFQALSSRVLPEDSKRKKVYSTVRDYID